VKTQEDSETEASSTQFVLASWFQSSLGAFFEEKKNIILISTDPEYVEIGNEFNIIDNHLLNSKPIRVLSEERAEFK